MDQLSHYTEGNGQSLLVLSWNELGNGSDKRVFSDLLKPVYN